MFAQARGARIQFDYKALGYRGSDAADWWRDVELPMHQERIPHYRIHPEDAHLQYGPISQALIDWALYGYDTDNHPEIDAAEAYFNWRLIIDGLPDPRLSFGDYGPRVTPDEWGMFRLFMAEMLADEGL